jgi:hypothetical protein
MEKVQILFYSRHGGEHQTGLFCEFIPFASSPERRPLRQTHDTIGFGFQTLCSLNSHNLVQLRSGHGCKMHDAQAVLVQITTS